MHNAAVSFVAIRSFRRCEELSALHASPKPNLRSQLDGTRIVAAAQRVRKVPELQRTGTFNAQRAIQDG